MSADFENILYAAADGVARITLNRPDKRNAQSLKLLAELNDAFDLAAHDEAVKVIILGANGPDFSSGHGPGGGIDLDSYKPAGTWSGFKEAGMEGHLSLEQEFFLGFCWRWRNIPKPTIAEVKGWVIAGGLMLMWPCDLVVAADNSKFTDPVVAFGVNGVEYFAHPWEVGVRKAKEMLFTGEVITAEEARALGMVNRVVPLDELEEHTNALAAHIATRPSMGLKLAKQSVNQMQDAQGMWEALQAAMSLQQLGHAHNQIAHGMLVDPEGGKQIQAALKGHKAKQATNE